MADRWIRFCPDEPALLALGAELAGALQPGLVVDLVGDLGMGKTTLARGVLRALGHGGAVKSPTYTLVEPYDLEDWPLYHFDLYRLSDPEELEFMGIRDYFSGDSVALVEWPQRGQGFLPPSDLVVTIALEGRGRRVEISASSESGTLCLAAMGNPVEAGQTP